MRRALQFALAGALVGLVAPGGLLLYGLLRGGPPDPVLVFATLAAGGSLFLGGAGFLVGQREEALARRNAELRALGAELERQSQTDALTGVCNRRAFDAQLAVELARARRYHTPLSLVMIDLDRFKQLNDRHGHPAGDEVLRRLGALLESEKRAGDLVCRYGGEEFAALLPHTGAQDALAWAERVRARLADEPIPIPAGQVRVTASFGVAERAAGDDAGTLVQAADQALYEAKGTGRNRSVLAAGRAPSPSIAPAPRAG